MYNNCTITNLVNQKLGCSKKTVFKIVRPVRSKVKTLYRDVAWLGEIVFDPSVHLNSTHCKNFVRVLKIERKKTHIFMSISWQIYNQSLSKEGGWQYLRENWWMEVFFTVWISVCIKIYISHIYANIYGTEYAKLWCYRGDYKFWHIFFTFVM